MGYVKIIQPRGTTFLIDKDDLPLLGESRWRLSSNNKRPKNRYICRDRPAASRGKKFHKLLHCAVMDPPEGMTVDHINRDNLDNRRNNLRLCTATENSRNRGVNENKKHSKYKGVCKNYRGGRWKARITKDKVLHRLGTYDTAEAAAKAYNEKALELFGEFACLNEGLK